MMNSRNNFLICHLTNSHQALDERIYFKAAKYAHAAGYRLCICGLHPAEETLEGIKILPVDGSGGIFKKLLKSLISLRRQALQTRADIYQFHDPALLPLGFLLALAGRRVIYDVHEDYEQKYRSRLVLPLSLGILFTKVFWIFEYLASRSFAHIITADSHICRKFATTRATVVPNVPGEEFWKDARRTRLNDCEFRLIYVGTLTHDRGIIETIRALDYVKHPGVTFHVAGETDDEELIRQLKNRPNVIWHGRIPWTDLGSALADSDLGIVLLQPVPAYFYYPGENIVKLWEYLSLGLPVLISNFPRLAKLCHEIGFGLAIDPTDPQKIAEAVDYLIDHPEERSLFAKNGLSAVRTEYCAEIKMQALIKVYDDLLEIIDNTKGGQ
jgi:glycosyltransferase involved in cell wall biosynthesis